MKKLFVLLIIVVILAGGYAYIQARDNPCNSVLAYSIGNVDPRFGISADDFLSNIKEMERVWEEPMEQELLKYDPNASFKINLVFDERQQKTVDERNSKQNIDLGEQTYQELVDQYNNLSYQHKQSTTEFQDKKAEYDRRLKEYNDEVAYWNKNGGAPSNDYKRLNEEKQALVVMSRQLDSQSSVLNTEINDMNSLAAKVNDEARKLNKDVDAYNGKFGEPRQFDQGTYNGSSINIYQFNEESDLRLVIAHELGHALKLDHIGDSQAIMYYLMDKQDLNHIQLSQGDLTAIKNKCQIP